LEAQAGIRCEPGTSEFPNPGRLAVMDMKYAR
jgi:hypothetical protein